MLTILQYLGYNFKWPSLIPILIISLLSSGLKSQTVSFQIVQDNKCAPSLVVFKNLSTAPPEAEYIWDFGKGAYISSDQKILQEAYTQPGTYQVSLALITGTDTTRTSKELLIAKGPVAGLSLGTQQGCPPLEVTIQENATAGDAAITSYFWDLRNGSVNTAPEFSYVYTENGYYSLFMKVTDANGCSDNMEMTNIIHVLPKPEANFVAADSFACEAPVNISFVNTSSGSGPLEYQWNFGNNVVSDEFAPTARYNEGGNYDVRLIVSDQNACSDTLIKENYITIGSLNGDIFAITPYGPEYEDSAELCPGNVTIRSTLPPQNDYVWKLNYNGSILEFNNSDEIDLILADSGYVEIELYINQRTACPDTLRQYYHIDFIEAGFTMDREYSCELPQDVVLTSTSLNADRFEWLFPDGSTDTLSSTAYTMEWFEDYRMRYRHTNYVDEVPFTLVATNANGCRDSVSRYLHVDLPAARLVPDVSSGCIPLEVNFSDSSISTEAIVQREYLLDGNSLGFGSDSFTHNLTDTGKYTFQLVITNGSGCSDTSYAITIQAGAETEVDFIVSPDELCYGDTLFITYTANGNDRIGSWQYVSSGLFNTGSSEEADPSVILLPSHPGTYPISAIVSENNCLSDTVFNDIITLKGPTGNFTYTFSCDSPFVYTFYPEVEGAETWTMNIRDSLFADKDSVIYTFPSPGDYEIILQAENAVTGCTMEKVRTISVRDVFADFYINPTLCLGSEANFDANTSTGYIENCHVEGFYWNFGDNSPPRRSYQDYFEYSYGDTGTYFPMLVVTAINGCTDTLTGEVKVVQPPAAFSAAPNIGCGPQLEVSFDYYSIDETVESFTWLFSDQTTDESNDPTVSHTFTGSFSTTVGAMLQVTDRYGCSNTSYVPVDMIVAVSIFQASDPDLCLGESAELILADPDVDWYEIDYGDGTPTSDLLTHTYTQAGTYDVSLSVMKNGCLANTTIPELISVEEADASFSVSDSISDCYPLTVAFTYNGNSEGIASGTWTFAEGVQSQEFSTMPTYTYTYPGTYVSSLEIRTLNDCRASIQKVIEIDGPFAEFTFTPEEICNGGEVAFTLLDTDNTDSFEWLFGDGSTSTDEHPVHTYSVIGDVFPAIHLSRGDCSVTLGGDTLHVSAIDAEFTLNPEKDSYCLDEAIFAINESDEYVTSLWSLNDVIVSNANNLSGIRFTGVGENSISLRVSNLIPCSDTIRKIFHVVPLPEFSIGGDSVICRDAETAQLHITGNSEDWSVLWLPASFVDNPSSFDPMASPDSSTTFTAVATDENQCSASENFDVRVIQPYDVNRSPLGDTVIYIGESLPLSVRSEDTHAKYAWSPPLGISCVTCNNPVVRPLFSTTYTVLISDACFESSYEFPIEVILDYYLEFPDAFSPNADGANDLFHPELKNVREIDLKLFNRWGNLVYHTNELTGSWDGRYQGKLQNPDTYTYYVKAISIHGYEFEKKGSFLLLW